MNEFYPNLEGQEEKDLAELFEEKYCEICDARLNTTQERQGGRCVEHLDAPDPMNDVDAAYYGE